MSCTTDQSQTIKLNVSNTVQIPIEFVTITVMVSEFGSDPSIVELSGYENLAKVVNLLRETGVDDDDLEIEAGQLTHSPYRGDDPFEFRTSIIFDLFDLDKIDTFRRAIVGAGGTSFRISSYGNKDEETIYDDAYRNAINIAKERAEKLLSNQSVKVGNIKNLHENIRETVEIIATAQTDYFAVYEEFDMQSVEPMFSKKFYTKNIQFNVEFELIHE